MTSKATRSIQSHSDRVDKALEIEKKFMLNIKRKQLLRLRTGNIEKLDGY